LLQRLSAAARRVASARALWLALIGAGVAACTPCPDEPREHDAALSLARQYFADYLRQQDVSQDVTTFDLVSERYQPQDRAWYFRLRSPDGACDMEIAVPDCEPTESAGGGCGSD
jgi:hypothetical protein